MEERNSHIDELIAAFLSKGLSKEAREETGRMDCQF